MLFHTKLYHESILVIDKGLTCICGFNKVYLLTQLVLSELSLSQKKSVSFEYPIASIHMMCDVIAMVPISDFTLGHPRYKNQILGNCIRDCPD